MARSKRELSVKVAIRDLSSGLLCDAAGAAEILTTGPSIPNAFVCNFSKQGIQRANYLKLNLGKSQQGRSQFSFAPGH